MKSCKAKTREKVEQHHLYPRQNHLKRSLENRLTLLGCMIMRVQKGVNLTKGMYKGTHPTKKHLRLDNL